jgi:type IV secretory pathway ATPase VirB11/archaellum biosynthesis ATPase
MVKYERVNSTLKIDCSNWVVSPRIEDSEAAMGVVIDILLKERGIEKIIMSEARENEYDFEQVRLLYSVAETYSKIILERKLITPGNLCICGKHVKRRAAELKFLILEVWRKDPIGAYVRLVSIINRIKKVAPFTKDKKCFEHYLQNALVPILNTFEECELIKTIKAKISKYRPGDRSLYREILSPVVRPAFMLTKFTFLLPPNARIIERYEVDGNKVEIYRIPERARFYYHITPKEFALSEVEYGILDEARKVLIARRPPELEIRDPIKAREAFLGLSERVIRDVAVARGVSLNYEKINELATILARYTVGFGILEILLADPRIQDVHVNSPIGATPIFIYHSDFEECETNLIPTMEEAEAWATRFRLYSGRPLDESSPVLDTELYVPGGRARVTAITRTLSPEGLAFAFRRHRERPWTFPLFMKVKMFNPLYAGVMSFIVDGGRSLLIAGGRASGKTSLLSALILELLRRFRVIVQEDTLEIPVTQIRNLGYNIERLKSRSVITRVEIELPAEEALRAALRLGDSALIIGEIRSKEAIALFEAMRIGALANVVAGTIHAETAYGVFDRVVNDLGVPRTSFKAIDLITICSRLKSPDGLHTFRRVVELTEVRKKWREDPLEEGAFVNLFEYSAKEDTLKPTETLLYGESYVLNEIAKRVREWKGKWDKVWDNILLRAKIKETLLDFAERLNRSEILEAEFSVKSNEMFHLFSEEVKEEVGELDSKMIYDKWKNWLKKELKVL